MKKRITLLFFAAGTLFGTAAFLSSLRAEWPKMETVTLETGEDESTIYLKIAPKAPTEPTAESSFLQPVFEQEDVNAAILYGRLFAVMKKGETASSPNSEEEKIRRSLDETDGEGPSGIAARPSSNEITRRFLDQPDGQFQAGEAKKWMAAKYPDDGFFWRLFDQAGKATYCDWQNGPESLRDLWRFCNDPLEESEILLEMVRIVTLRIRLETADANDREAVRLLRAGYAAALHLGENRFLLSGLRRNAAFQNLNRAVADMMGRSGTPNFFWSLRELSDRCRNETDYLRADSDVTMALFLPEVAAVLERREILTPDEWREFCGAVSHRVQEVTKEFHLEPAENGGENGAETAKVKTEEGAAETVKENAPSADGERGIGKESGQETENERTIRILAPLRSVETYRPIAERWLLDHGLTRDRLNAMTPEEICGRGIVGEWSEYWSESRRLSLFSVDQRRRAKPFDRMENREFQKENEEVSPLYCLYANLCSMARACQEAMARLRWKLDVMAFGEAISWFAAERDGRFPETMAELADWSETRWKEAAPGGIRTTVPLPQLNPFTDAPYEFRVNKKEAPSHGEMIHTGENLSVGETVSVGQTVSADEIVFEIELAPELSGQKRGYRIIFQKTGSPKETSP